MAALREGMLTRSASSLLRSTGFVSFLASASFAAGCSASPGNGFDETDAAAPSSGASAEAGAADAAASRPDAGGDPVRAKPTSGAGSLAAAPSDAGTGGFGNACPTEGATQHCGRGASSDAAAGAGVDAAALVTQLADAGCLLGSQTCNSGGEFLAWGACTTCALECRTESVTFSMLQDNDDSPDLDGNEQIVAVANTGGGWCNCGDNGSDCGYSCPLACPGALVSSDGTSMSVAMFDAPGQYGDNSGACGYELTICGTK